MDKKKEKKGFWASLFAPKPCNSSCGGFTIEEVDSDKQITEKESSKQSSSASDKSCKCK